MTEVHPDVATRPLDRTLVLVGLMGAGKSTVGRRLATRLGVPFVAADHAIETAAGATLPGAAPLAPLTSRSQAAQNQSPSGTDSPRPTQ